MHQLLWEEAPMFAGDPWAALATRTGITDTLSFVNCLSDAETSEAIEDDVRIGNSLNIVQTPTVIIGNRFFRGSPGLRYMRACTNRAAIGLGC
jgi:protein-disulfide isomerase